MPDRIAAADRALESRVWREDMERWEHEVKPAAIRAHLEIQAIDPVTLTLDELLVHLERCRQHQRRMIVQHHTFNGAALGPVGDLIAHVGDWTGIESARIVALARGAAPESAAASDELDRLLAALASDRRARALVDDDGEPGELLARLAGMDGEAGRAAGNYIERVGFRLLDSFDIVDPYALEMPEILLGRLRRAVERGGGHENGPSEDELAQVRDRVPAEHRDEFDTLLAETRLTSRVRDERGVFSDVWAGGLTRRAILAAGALLARQGRLAEGAHLVEADYAEMCDLIRQRGGPPAEELARRAQARADSRVDDAPDALGDPPPPPPPLHALPLAARRVNRAIATALGEMFGDAEAESEPGIVRGIAASPGTYTGTARVIRGPQEFGRLRQGDVLVAVSTIEAFNVVLPFLGALVTDAGGVLSHAAIVSREYGIPGVVGTRDATRMIQDGTLVRVLGDTGEVEILG